MCYYNTRAKIAILSHTCMGQVDFYPQNYAIFIDEKRETWNEQDIKIDKDATEDPLNNNIENEVKKCYCPRCDVTRDCPNESLKKCYTCKGALRYVCGRCGMHYKGYKWLVNHLDFHCEDKTMGKTNRTRRAFAQHAQLPPLKACPECGKTKSATSFARLRCSCERANKRHMPSRSVNSKHKVKKEQKFECDFCKKSFHTKMGLQMHKLKKEHKFECDFCKKSFLTKLGLQMHKLWCQY